MTIRAVLASLCTALAMCVSSPAWAGYQLSLSPSASTGVVGGQVTVDVNLALDAGDNVNTIGFSLGYDAAVLSYVSGSGIAGSLITGSLGLWDVQINGVPTNQINFAFLDLFLLGLDGPIAGEAIAKVTFDLIGVGNSPISLADAILEGFDFQTLSPVLLVAQQSTADVVIAVDASNNVPAPASLLLVGLGLAALGWTRRRVALR